MWSGLFLSRVTSSGRRIPKTATAKLRAGALIQSPSTIGSETHPWGGSVRRVPRWALAAAKARSYSVRTVESNSQM